MNYKRIYDNLIEKARTRIPPEGYIERHHIIPRCLGGGDSDENLVALTPEEHYLAHQLLVKMHPNEGSLIYAANKMCVGNSNHKRKSNKRYGWLKRRFSEQRKLDSKGSGNPQHGTMWINKTGTTENRKIKKDEPIPDGWQKGRKIKKTMAKRKRTCRVCGSHDCKHKEICKKHRTLDAFAKFFGLSSEAFGSEKIYDEFCRVRNVLYKEYHENLLSVQQIADKYGVNSNERMRTILEGIGIERRNQSECANNFLKRNI